MNFQIELTSYCDLSCGYCPNHDMQRRRSFMNDETWEAILCRYITPYRHHNKFSPPTFIPHKDGEPLLNKRLHDRLRDVATMAPDMKIDIYSHGLLLPKWRERGQDFIDFLASLPNQSRYMMSFHPTNHDYTANDYGPVILYLKEVLRHRKPANVEFITVSHRSKWVSENVQEAWRREWEGLPITVHCNTHINPWTGLMEDVATCHYDGCPYADFGHWFFGATGNVIACCLDLEEEIVLGNVLRDDPAEMFARTEAFYVEQRRLKEAGSLHPRGVCRNCFGQRREDVPLNLMQLGMMS